MLETGAAETISPATQNYNTQTTTTQHCLDIPAHGVDVWLLVEVVAVLADVVQGGVDGRVIPAPALIRHPSIPLATSHKLQQIQVGSNSVQDARQTLMVTHLLMKYEE